MTKLIELLLKNLINVGRRLRSENFKGMLTCFLISMARTNHFGQGKVAFLEKRFKK